MKAALRVSHVFCRQLSGLRKRGMRHHTARVPFHSFCSSNPGVCSPRCFRAAAHMEPSSGTFRHMWYGRVASSTSVDIGSGQPAFGNNVAWLATTASMTSVLRFDTARRDREARKQLTLTIMATFVKKLLLVFLETTSFVCQLGA